MPLKELAYLRADSSDELVKKITSANTLLNVGGKWVALSTDLLAFKSLIEIDSYAKVGVIGGGGTARAALGALSGEISSVDVFLRSPNRFDALQTAAGETKVNIKEMDQINNNYDLLISTTPAGVLDTHVDKLAGGQGTFFEVLYKPWPTNAVSAWNGKIISGLDLLVEQAMYQITFMTGQDFNYHMMRGRLLAVAK
jgi:shikimate dehydrogenase